MITSYKSTYQPTIDGVPIGVVAQAFATYSPISPANYAWSEVMGSQSSRYITYLDINGNVYYSLGVRGQLTPINIKGGLGVGAFTQIGVLGDIFYATNTYAGSQNFHVRNLANGKYICGSDFTLVGDNTTALSVPVVWSNNLAISQNGLTSIQSEGVYNCQPGSTLASDGTDLCMISNGLNGGLNFVILKNKQAILSGFLEGEASFGVSVQGGFIFSSKTEYCFNVNQNWPNDGVLRAINMTKNGEFLNEFNLDISEDIFNLPGGIYQLDNESIQAGVNYLRISGFSIIPEKVFGILLPFGNNDGPGGSAVAKTLFLSLNSNWETIGQIVIDDAINSTHVMEDGRLLLLGILGSYQVDVYAVNITPSSALTNYGFVLPSDSNLQPYMFSDIREIFGGTIPKAPSQNRKTFLGQLL